IKVISDNFNDVFAEEIRLAKSEIINAVADAISKARCRKNFMSGPIMKCVSKYEGGRESWTNYTLSTDGRYFNDNVGCPNSANDQLEQQVNFSQSDAVDNQGLHNTTCFNYQFVYNEALASC
uniref:Uncharacterized protein n=1 Tax=Romanomermis culicivorax TaxID=13658 RepID=A0A915HYH7_ROMCU